MIDTLRCTCRFTASSGSAIRALLRAMDTGETRLRLVTVTEPANRITRAVQLFVPQDWVESEQNDQAKEPQRDRETVLVDVVSESRRAIAYLSVVLDYSWKSKIVHDGSSWTQRLLV